MVQPQLVKIGGPWTRSMIRGSMDPVHEREGGGSMDPVHVLMDPVHGPGPRRGSMDQGSMFCTFPIRPVKIDFHFSTLMYRLLRRLRKGVSRNGEM